MKRIGVLGALVGLIAAITILSGVLQMCWPALVLGFVGGQTGATADHFFGIIGMFMVLFGGLMLHGVLADSAPALLWSSLQKFGAVAAVVLGVYHSIFSSMALGVAGFDLLSGLLAIFYWHKIARIGEP
ncbi:MAG: patatin [Gammaproteobacteria bacterium]